jgi:hypothetical protein
VSAQGFGRLGMLALGLGIGAAVASMPGIASADSSTDWLPSIDNLVAGLALPAQPSDLNLAISIDGHSLVSDGSASATSGTGDVAIAYGAGSSATASGGIGDVAFANGSDSSTTAGEGNYDFASATGADSQAEAVYGDGDSATAANGEAFTMTGNDDHASAINFGSADDFAYAINGNNNVATAIDTGSTQDFAFAGGSSGDAGSGDIAYILGTDSSATAGTHFGSASEIAGSFDLAAAFGDDYGASATGSNFVVDILPSL